MHPRTREDHEPALKVVREIPLWGIITVVGMVGAQAVGSYYQLDRLAEKQKEQGELVRSISARVDQVSTAIQDDRAKRDAKDLEHDFKIQGLDSRVTNLERRR